MGEAIEQYDIETREENDAQNKDDTVTENSEEEKQGVVAEQIGTVKVACREEEICDAVTHGQPTETHEEHLKWFVVGSLVLILIAIIAVRFSNTPAATRGDSNPIYGQQRDLSTPSSRVEGHWRNEERTTDSYYSITEPSLKIGYFIIHNKRGRPSAPLRFKILFEDPSGTELVIRPYGVNESLRALSVEIGMECWMSDVTYTIPKHGQSMTQEGTLMGDPILSVYRYVDDKTSP